MKVKVFRYINDIDAFVLTDDYIKICDFLEIEYWERYAWIGRLFTLDNDYGEHWMDNWELRDAVEDKSKKFGFDSSELLIIDPVRFIFPKTNHYLIKGDEPCHSNKFRKLFWNDVMMSLEISLDLIIEEANENAEDFDINKILKSEDNSNYANYIKQKLALNK